MLCFALAPRLHDCLALLKVETVVIVTAVLHLQALVLASFPQTIHPQPRQRFLCVRFCISVRVCYDTVPGSTTL
eukprot:m.117804 g.117804  ORF g.117804 m.117804 type:complete len:74 (+) comp13638_c0_seq2:3705-3926(+)